MKIVEIIMIAILSYLFLIAPRMRKGPDRTPFLNRHYAHRGLFDNKSEAPENSLEAFRKAVENGYGIELDVQLSKEGIPVVFHDKSLKRMCNMEGLVWEYTLEELKSLRLADSKERIPTLKEALEVIGGKVPVIVEYKLDKIQTEVCRKGNALLEKYEGSYCVESFHPLALLWYKKNRPEILRGQLSREFWKEKEYRAFIYTLMAFLVSNVVTRPDFIAYHHKDASNISRRLCKWMGALSVAWTIKSQEDYEKTKDQFDLFIFDHCRL